MRWSTQTLDDDGSADGFLPWQAISAGCRAAPRWLTAQLPQDDSAMRESAQAHATADIDHYAYLTCLHRLAFYRQTSEELGNVSADFARAIVGTILQGAADGAVAPGQRASPEVLKFERHKASLEALAARFATEGFSWGTGDARIISHETAKAFSAILERLPYGSHLPRIAPDEGGALALHWNNGNTNVIASLEGWRLHVVENPATPETVYHPNLEVDADRGAPVALLKAINR